MSFICAENSIVFQPHLYIIRLYAHLPSRPIPLPMRTCLSSRLGYSLLHKRRPRFLICQNFAPGQRQLSWTSAVDMENKISHGLRNLARGREGLDLQDVSKILISFIDTFLESFFVLNNTFFECNDYIHFAFIGYYIIPYRLIFCSCQEIYIIGWKYTT